MRACGSFPELTRDVIARMTRARCGSAAGRGRGLCVGTSWRSHSPSACNRQWKAMITQCVIGVCA